MNYKPDPKIYELGDDFYDPVQAADFPETKLRYRDDAAANALGLKLNDAEWISHFGRFKALPDNLSEPLSPTRSAVMVRLNHSHIRFGSFQRQAFFNHTDNLEKLTAYCLRHYYSDAEGPAGLLRAAAISSADMVASWMAAGFVHGVMNTDNMNITGETFDFGPYRFLPTLKSDFTAAYFDYNKLYALSSCRRFAF